VECQAAGISWLDIEVLEGFRCRVNLLINKFSFDFVGRGDRPPECLVEDAGHWLEDELRDIDMSAMLDNFPIHQLSNLCCGIILWAVEFVGLRGGIIILEHFFKALAHVDYLERSVAKKKIMSSLLT
jgi:hypothetical protein